MLASRYTYRQFTLASIDGIASGRGQIGLSFHVPGSVAKSTHAGLPWLRYLRQQMGTRVHFWPFDGWVI